MTTNQPIKILFVCMGNICRSPTAHGIFRSLIENQGLQQALEVDSAGTHSYHIGNPPDLRSQSTALERGVDLSDIHARRLTSSDFIEFDYLLAMDRRNLADMRAIQPDDDNCSLELMLKYSEKFQQIDVPDPYFDDQGFELVFDMLDDAAQGLLRDIKVRYEI